MLASYLLALGLAATGLAQTTIPTGYREVVITSSWNAEFVIQPVTPVKSGSGIVLYGADNKIEQQWYLKDNSTKIQLSNTTLCLDAGTGRSNGSPLSVTDCDATKASQNWVYNTDSQIVLDQAGAKLCADLYTGSVTANTKIVLWQCIAGDKNHIWKAVNATVV